MDWSVGEGSRGLGEAARATRPGGQVGRIGELEGVSARSSIGRLLRVAILRRLARRLGARGARRRGEVRDAAELGARCKRSQNEQEREGVHASGRPCHHVQT